MLENIKLVSLLWSIKNGITIKKGGGNMVEALSGKKTYIVAAAGAIIFFLRQAGVVDIPADTEKTIYEVLGLLLACTFRSALK